MGTFNKNNKNNIFSIFFFLKTKGVLYNIFYYISLFKPRGVSLFSKERKGPKGQATLISHAILIGLGLLLILSVIVTLNMVKSNYGEFIGDKEARILCSLIKHSIEEMYLESDYRLQTDTLTGKIVLRLPQRLGDSVYRVRFVDDTLLIETHGELNLNASCIIGFNASYTGTTPGGITEVRWTKLTTGQNIIELVKV